MTWLDWPLLWLTLTRLLVLLFTLFIAWMTYRTHQLIRQIHIEGNVLLSLPETLSRIGLVGFCLFLAWLSGLPAEQLGFVADQPLRVISLGLAIGLVAQVVVYGLSQQAIRWFGPDIYSTWLIRNILPRRPLDWPLIALAFIPPVLMEELLFRSLLLGLFQDLIPAVLWIGLTSVVFGFMHQPQGRLGILLAGLLNVALCCLFIWSGSLLLPLVAHYTINVMQVAVAYHQRHQLPAN